MSASLEVSSMGLARRIVGASIALAVVIALSWAGTEPIARAEPPQADVGAPKKKKPFSRSKLTYDESEGLADRRRLLLTTGEDKAVDLDFEANAGAQGISIGNPQVVATTLVRIDKKFQLVFKPLKGGETTVSVRDADGNIKLIFTVVVTGNNLLRRAAEIRELLRDIEGIDVRVVGQKIAIDGQVLVPNDYTRLLSVVTDKAYSDLIINLSTMSPLSLQVLAKRIGEDIATFAPNVKTRVVNGVIWLEGTVDNGEMANRAVSVATLYLPEARPGNPLLAKDPGAQSLTRPLIKSFILVNPAPPKKQEKLVRVTVHYVELSKDYSKAFGFKWEPGFTADPTITIGSAQQGGSGAATTSFTATVSSLVPKLQSAQSAGFARVLKTGTVIVRSGQPAKLEETTQFPFVVLGQAGAAQAASQNVGISLAVTPQILGQSEDIAMDLDLNQINLVGRAPAGGPPVVSNHKVTTKIYVKNKESAAVAGVIATDVGTDFNKDDPRPGSFEGTTEPLFSLLRSKAYRKKKSQFVIFVTPEIVDNASEGTEDLKKNFRIRVK